jgi:HEAT repeat protein
MAGTAELIAVGEVGAIEPDGADRTLIEFRIVEQLKGPQSQPATVSVVHYTSHGPDLEVGGRALFFASPLPEEAGPDRHFLVSGPFGAVRLTEENEAAQLDYVRAHLRLRSDDATPADLVLHLATACASATDKVRLSAALDFVRLEASGLAPISEAQVAVIARGFETSEWNKKPKWALARALGETRSEAAAAPLAAAVLTGKSRPIRAVVGEALCRIGVASAVSLLRPGLAVPDAGVRADVANVLGRTGLASAATLLIEALSDAESEVRVEAALGLGEVARAVRAKEGRTLDLHEALGNALSRAKTMDETKALLWTAAQLDTQNGYDLVRTARGSEDPDVRKFAARVLSNPRRRIVLR